MSTSGSADYSTSALNIIKRALRLLGVLPSGGSPTTEQTNDAMYALNTLAKSWMADGMPLWAIKSYTMSLTDGVNSYRIGDSQTVNTPKPLKITQVLNRNITSFVDIPMRGLSRQEYNMLGNKTVEGNPIQYFYDPQRNYGDLYVFPTPSSVEAAGNTLILFYQRPFEDFDSNTDEPDFPQEWFDALAYGLACRLAPEYGISLQDRKQLWQEMTIIKQEALNFGLEEGSMFFSRDFRNW